MAQERKGGLGRGLAALIPSAPSEMDKSGKTGGIGGGASDVIFGTQRQDAPERPEAGDQPTPAAPKPQAPKGAPQVAGAPRAVPGAPTVAATRENVMQPVPVGARYQEIPLGQIIPNPKQPRQVFDEDELNELVHSIREFGLLQPIVVRDTRDGFELIMGERRWRAASKAGLKYIPAIVRETSDQDMLRDALLENIHRVQLNPLEEAAAYQQLLEEFGVTQEQLADKLGRSRPAITNAIRLLGLPVAVQRRVAAGVLSAGHARALLGIKLGDDTEQAQSTLADRIVAEGLSVRATEEAVTLLNKHGEAPSKPKREPTPQPEYFTHAAERLADVWDTKVSVTMGKRKGKIVVEFGDRDDFERIMSLIKGEE
ncbi:ParB/RepB/Spo0J family partition protein [Corynebacterium aquatimens]|uniref:ParB/RepB/Spo0J family partition protein n=1 Tax=Corynebacterium TaxID=1716 RepID=UPI001F490DD9|nr:MULTISPECIES: ParB/RepB/Spo0J family partition protein [Corynebacterium]QYH19005.1 ParB/RepB/Spo0J family partition protein [Corynebacterium aquatimens]UIZ92146.1 ParB/RepB/Spo0J family partition protein [Corynebacterium sp. CNCTC7651]